MHFRMNVPMMMMVNSEGCVRVWMWEINIDLNLTQARVMDCFSPFHPSIIPSSMYEHRIHDAATFLMLVCVGKSKRKQRESSFYEKIMICWCRVAGCERNEMRLISKLNDFADFLAFSTTSNLFSRRLRLFTTLKLHPSAMMFSRFIQLHLRTLLPAAAQFPNEEGLFDVLRKAVLS